MKYAIKTAVLALLLIQLSARVQAQAATRIITGIVRSAAEHEPLEGVAIAVKGTKNASGTQPDGVYYIQVQATDSILTFSFPGYQSVEIRITNSNEYNVELKRTNTVSNQLYWHLPSALVFDNIQTFLICKPIGANP